MNKLAIRDTTENHKRSGPGRNREDPSTRTRSRSEYKMLLYQSEDLAQPSRQIFSKIQF